MTSRIISRPAYVRLRVEELDAGAAFMAEVLGLEPSSRSDDAASFRADERFCTVMLDRHAVEPAVIGVELDDAVMIDEAQARLSSGGYPVERMDAATCARLNVRAGLSARDNSGTCIELVTGVRHSGRRYFPSRDAGVMGFQGVALRSTDIAGDTTFWTDCLGADVRDRAGEITLIGTDEHHHRIALYPSDQAGLLYTVFEVESIDNIMQSYYFAQGRQIRIVQGPGRQPASRQIFLHIEGPGGAIFTFVTGGDRVDPARHRVRQFAPNALGLCNWGTVCTERLELAPTEQ